MRKLRLAGGIPPVLLALAPGPGMLVVHSWADLGLHVFNINGRHLVSADGNERLAALAISPDGHFLLTGGQRGVASLHWLHSLEVPHTAMTPVMLTATCASGRIAPIHCVSLFRSAFDADGGKPLLHTMQTTVYLVHGLLIIADQLHTGAVCGAV